MVRAMRAMSGSNALNINRAACFTSTIRQQKVATKISEEKLGMFQDRKPDAGRSERLP